MSIIDEKNKEAVIQLNQFYKAGKEEKNTIKYHILKKDKLQANEFQ